MIDDLDFLWLLYAAIAISCVVGALILLTPRPTRPVSQSTLRRLPPAPREPTTPDPGVPEKQTRR